MLDTVRSWSDAGSRFALATVVGVRGSTYRGLCARQLFSEDGASVGTVSGGCLDQDLRAVALRVIESDRPEVVEFDLTADDEAVWGWGIGCNGATRLLVETGSTASALADLLASPPAGTFCVVHPLADPASRWVVTSGSSPDGGTVSEALAAIGDGRHRTATFGDAEYLFEVVGAPRRVVVFGAGHDAAPVVSLAASMGFQVLVVDDRRPFLTRERFPDAHELIHADPGDLATVVRPDAKTSVVLMSHNYLRDLDALRSLIGTDVAYVGTLGPGARLERMLGDLADDDVPVRTADLARLHGPAGLDVGAEGPAEIALSVVSEILAVARERTGSPLRESKGPGVIRSGSTLPTTRPNGDGAHEDHE